MIEVRYPRGYLHWDRSGKIANDLLLRFPGIEVDEGSPAEVTLSHKDEQVTFVYGVQLARVVLIPKSAQSDKLGDYANEFINIVLRNLEVKTLTRVAQRVIYHILTESKAEAEERLEKFAKRHHAGANVLSSSGDERLSAKKLRELMLRFEDEKTGINITLKAGESVFNITGPNSDELRPHIPPPKYFLVFSADIYTKQPLAAAELIVSELIRSNDKLVSTRLLPLFTD